MAFGNWSDNDLGKSDGEVLSAADYNDDIDETMPPVGAVIAWLKSFTGVPGTLPSGWVECDGSTISDADSPLNGQAIPNLNGDARFLKGSSTSGTAANTMTAGSASHSHGGATGDTTDYGSTGSRSQTHTISTDAASHTHADKTYTVVWIIRIK